MDLTDSFTWEDLPTRDADTGYLTAAGWIPLIKMFSKAATIATISFYCIQSTIRIMTSHDSIITAWYPFDSTVSPFYELVIVSEGFTALFHMCVTYGFPSLVASFLAVACAQFEKLNAAILDIKQDHIAPHHGQEDEQVHTIPNSSLQAKLKACIRQHQEIMTFVQELENALNMVLCGTFLILLATMCFAAFSVVTNWGDYANTSVAVLVYTVYFSNVLLICWFGTQLTQRAESVRDAAFGCDWVGTPIPFQRCLMFIIATANKQFQLTAGKFVPVSNVTMMNIMQDTLSFFMFLLQVKDKNGETKQEKL